MGNSESSNPIRNMDKRTARREYREAFNAYIANYRLQRTNNNPNKPSKVSQEEWENGNIKVFVRKRPIFKHELENHEFDVITACFSTTKDVIVHDVCAYCGLMKYSLIYLHSI